MKQNKTNLVRESGASLYEISTGTRIQDRATLVMFPGAKNIRQFCVFGINSFSSEENTQSPKELGYQGHSKVLPTKRVQV